MTARKPISLVVAMYSHTNNFKQPRPWNLKWDWFKSITNPPNYSSLPYSSTLILGSNFWENIPAPLRPFPGRLNIVLTTRNIDIPRDVLMSPSLPNAIKVASAVSDNIYVVGGHYVFKQAIDICDSIIVNRVYDEYRDSIELRIPGFNTVKRSDINIENGIKYQIITLRRKCPATLKIDKN